jgi:hypothetical protein
VTGPLLAPLGYTQPGARAKLAATPNYVGESMYRLHERLRRPASPLSPAARYELTRKFLDDRARRVGAAP